MDRADPTLYLEDMMVMLQCRRRILRILTAKFFTNHGGPVTMPVAIRI